MKIKYIDFVHLNTLVNPILKDPISGIKVYMKEDRNSNNVIVKATFKHRKLRDKFKKENRFITRFVFQNKINKDITFIKFDLLPKKLRKKNKWDFGLIQVSPLIACEMIERNRKMVEKL